MSVALNFRLQHLDFVVPLKDLVLLVGDFQAELGSSGVPFAYIKPEFFILRDDLCFDIIEGYLGLKHSNPSVYIEDLDNQRNLIVFHLKLELWVGIGGCLSACWSRLPMFVALVADDVRVLDTVKVLSADNRDEQVAHRALNVPVVLSLCVGQLLLGLLKPLMVHHDLGLDLIFTLDKLIFSRNILHRELLQVDTAIIILVQLLEELSNDLAAMVIIDSALS